MCQSFDGNLFSEVNVVCAACHFKTVLFCQVIDVYLRVGWLHNTSCYHPEMVLMALKLHHRCIIVVYKRKSQWETQTVFIGTDWCQMSCFLFEGKLLSFVLSGFFLNGLFLLCKSTLK